MTLSLLAAACATLDTRIPVPNAMLAARAAPLDLEGLRAWGDEVPSDMAAEMRHRMPHLKRLAQSTGQRQPSVDILALSGGGTDGAFSAGLLAGWTKRGDRPRFEVVTGVSAGAITAMRTVASVPAMKDDSAAVASARPALPRRAIW